MPLWNILRKRITKKIRIEEPIKRKANKVHVKWKG